jgi:hypothetical protein
LNLLFELGNPTTTPRLVRSLSHIGTHASVPWRDVHNEKAKQNSRRTQASIKVEMEDICDWPTDMVISVQPDGDSWIAVVGQEGSADDADRRQMIEQIATRLKAEYDLKG